MPVFNVLSRLFVWYLLDCKTNAIWQRDDKTAPKPAVAWPTNCSPWSACTAWLSTTRKSSYLRIPITEYSITTERFVSTTSPKSRSILPLSISLSATAICSLSTDGSRLLPVPAKSPCKGWDYRSLRVSPDNHGNRKIGRSNPVRFFCAVCNAARPVIGEDGAVVPVRRATVSACKCSFRPRYVPTAFCRGYSYKRGIAGLPQRGYPL